MPEEKKTIKKPHSLILEDRKALTVTGVLDVGSFDEQVVVASTDHGDLVIRGSGLEISRLNVETGELVLSGEVVSVTYTESVSGKNGLFSKLFR